MQRQAHCQVAQANVKPKPANKLACFTNKDFAYTKKLNLC
jgi:hypothetical protein